jgi:hypothetical protein
MADDYRTTPEKALDDLLTFALDDDDAVGRRILRVRRRARDEGADRLAGAGETIARER